MLSPRLTFRILAASLLGLLVAHSLQAQGPVRQSSMVAVKVDQEDCSVFNGVLRIGDIAEVEATIAEACRTYRVVEVVCDPFRWQRSMQEMAAAGLPIVEYNSSSPARMVPATAKTYDAVMSGGLAHDHNPTLARHLNNCVVKTDRLGPRITKEHRNSPRKIDAAVAFVMAFDRATWVREHEVVPEVNFY